MAGLLLSVTVVAVLLLCLERVAELRTARRFPAPGRILDSPHLHVVEMGSGRSTVVLEAGLAASSQSWVLNQSKISEFSRVIAYDRPGLGWSPRTKSRVTLDSLVSILDRLTQKLELRPPVILVGHSFGGLLVQAFACRKPALVAAMLLIDPVSISALADPTIQQQGRIELGIKLCWRGSVLARFGIVRAALMLAASGKLKVPALIGRLSAPNGASVINRLASEINKLPSSTHAVIAGHWSRPHSFIVLAEYLGMLNEFGRQAQAMMVPQHIPVIVLSAANATPAELSERDRLTGLHAASRHVQVPHTTHWLQLDRPDVVTDAVRELAMLIK